MNGKKAIFFIIPVVILTLSIILFQIESKKNENFNIIEEEVILENIETPVKSNEEVLSEISEKYENIEESYQYDKFFSRDREWQTSGPFSIDRSEYGLGEKIFFKAEGILPSENGEIVFLRYLNDTHYKVWTNYSFDGMKKNAFNIYFEPVLSLSKNICDKNMLLVDWVVVFRNTNYENLHFSIIDKIVPGDEYKFEQIIC